MKKDSLCLKWARKPTEGKPLSGIVRVKDYSKVRRNNKYRHGVCTVSFSDKELERVGKQMPRGVSVFDPAFIEVEIYKDVYGIFCVYFKDGYEGESVLLYKTDVKPYWLRPRWFKGAKANANSSS